MLVLTRRPNETLHIGDVTIRVLNVRGNHVKLGIDAPRETDIWRGRNGKDGSGSVNPNGVETTPAGDGHVTDDL